MADANCSPTAPRFRRARHRVLVSPLRLLDLIGRGILRFLWTAEELVAFAVIALGVVLQKAGLAARVTRPMIRAQVARAGWQLLPLTGFLAFALGLVIIGQTLALMSRVGAQNYAGTVMVAVVVRELGPLAVALLALARVGAAYVIELGMARALGEVEALEALCIDPLHLLVVPRMAGLTIALFSLTVYFIMLALASGYLFAFLQDIPLRPAEYVRQLAAALTWQDFVFLAVKTSGFGILIAIVTCFQGLARPLRLEDVAAASTRAVVQSVVGCVLLDLGFVGRYLIR